MVPARSRRDNGRTTQVAVAFLYPSSILSHTSTAIMSLCPFPLFEDVLFPGVHTSPACRIFFTFQHSFIHSFTSLILPCLSGITSFIIRNIEAPCVCVFLLFSPLFPPYFSIYPWHQRFYNSLASRILSFLVD